MKKIFILFLLVLVAGCAKKLPPPSEAPMQKETMRETAEPATTMEKETVREAMGQKEAKLQESEMGMKAEGESIFKDALFDYDKYSIRDDARPVLDAVAAYLKKNANVVIIVEGHCDDRGTNEYNLALGEKRAKAAKDYLVSLGVSSSRMSTVTYGEEKPLCSEQNETCWQKNRRAHFVVQK